MDDAAYIIALARTESHSLGFIPAATVRSRYLQAGTYRVLRDGKNRRRGFLLHGPIEPGRPIFITQTVVEIDHRLRGIAAAAVQSLFRLGLAAGATEIRLRCALDLAANQFWTALGFQLTHYTPGGRYLNRTLAHYVLPIAPAPSNRELFQLV